MKYRFLTTVVLSSIVIIHAIISSKGSTVKEGFNIEKSIGKILIDAPLKKNKSLKPVYKKVKSENKIFGKLGILIIELFVSPPIKLVLNPLMGVALSGIAIYGIILILPHLFSFLLSPMQTGPFFT